MAKKKQEIERKRKRKAEGDDAGDDDADKEDEEDDESVDISLPVILVFFILVCGFLISLYFFYEYLGEFFGIYLNYNPNLPLLGWFYEYFELNQRFLYSGNAKFPRLT